MHNEIKIDRKRVEEQKARKENLLQVGQHGNNNEVVIGEIDKYEARCRKCFKI